MNNRLRLFNESTLKMLKLITLHDDLHVREIAERLGISPATVHYNITLLKKMGIIAERAVKNRKVVVLKRENIILKKLKSLINIYEFINHPAFKELERVGNVGIYGSFASGEDLPESDIDVWIYSEQQRISIIDLKPITRKIEKRFGKDVKILVLTNEKIKKLKENDPEFYYRLKLTSIFLNGDVFD